MGSSSSSQQIAIRTPVQHIAESEGELIVAKQDQDTAPDGDKDPCPICLNSCVQPKTLSCQHTMCFRCLQRYINSLDNTNKIRGFPCPVCKMLIIIANPETPRQTWAAQLEEPGEISTGQSNEKRHFPGIGSEDILPDKPAVISARMKTDKIDPMLVDIVVLDVHGVTAVVVADFNNKSVKSLYKKRGKDTHSTSTLESNPFCMALLTDKTLAVTLPWLEKICFVDVTPEVRLVKTFKTEKAYYGIAELDEDFIAVSTTWQAPSSIDIVDHDGRVLNSIDSNDYGGCLLSDPWYISVTPSGDVLVSDCQEQSLSCLDQSGHTKWSYKPRSEMKLKQPAGVACDREGSIYLADIDTNSVIKLNENGEFVTTVASENDGLDHPRCLTITESDQLYVALENGCIYMLPLGNT